MDRNQRGERMNFTQDEITMLIGEQRLEIAFLARQLKQAQARIAELEKKDGVPSSNVTPIAA